LSDFGRKKVPGGAHVRANFELRLGIFAMFRQQDEKGLGAHPNWASADAELSAK